LRNAHAVVANSKGLALPSERVDPFPVHVIPNGVDTSFFYPPQCRPAGPFTVLFVGRFQKVKNLPTVIQAFASAFKGRDVQLRMIGDGPQREELAELIRQLGIERQVTMIPWQDKDQLRHEYHNAHCLINYSFAEGMPNVVLEAIACGLPVIVSDIMGHQELVEYGRDVKLGEPFVPDSLARLLLETEKSSRIPIGLRRQSPQSSEPTHSWYASAMSYLRL
jgi:glycosyltransferase involved in cell wall biosynthesis